MKETISTFVLSTALFALLITFSCGKDSKSIAINDESATIVLQQNYPPTIFPSDTTALWLGEGDMKRDTVLIAADGGPKNQLDYEFNGRTQWSYLPGFKNYIFANVHQSSTYNPEIFKWNGRFTLEDGKKEVDNSSEMLYRTIKYFKDRNKYVIVVGHSYGAFVIPHYLATRPSLADTYLVTGGRLIADSLQTFYQLKGFNSGFLEDGKTLRVPDTLAPKNPDRTERYYRIRQAKEMLKGGLSIYDFTEELKDQNLSNFYFFYGLKDQNVGVPYSKELDFLKVHGAKVYGVDSDHYNIWKHAIDSIKSGAVKL